MKNIKKKGFTLVELVIVIAVIAILAGVLIGTFASVLKRAKDSADVQNIKNAEIAQKADDIIKKIDDSNWFGWEDFEAKIVEKITTVVKANSSSFDSNALKSVVEDVVTTAIANMENKNTDLTEDQVKAIVENALGTLKYEGVTEAQVRAIVNAATNTLVGTQLSAAQVRSIITVANENKLTAAQVAEIVGRANFSTPNDVQAAVTTITAALTNVTSGLATSAQAEEIKGLIEQATATIKSGELNDVILAKGLNIKLDKSNKVIETPSDVVAVLGQTNPVLGVSFDNLVLLDLTNEAFVVVKNETGYPVVYATNIVSGTPLGDTYKYWTFVEEELVSPTYSEFSVYLLDGSSANTITLNGVGLDVGNTVVDEIEYTNDGTERSVIICTNGGSLTINDEDDTVIHYGIANKVDIKAVAGTSYVENGIVSIAKIKTGRIVVTPKAVLTSIHVVETNGNYNNIKVALVGNAELPSFTRDEVTMNDGDKKLVIEVQSIATLTAVDESPEYVWISKIGAVVSTDIATSGTTLNEETKVPETSQTAAAKAVANDTIEGTTAEELAEMEAVATRYAGGQGTESNPYLLATKEHFGSVDEDYHNGVTEGKYYKLVADLDLGKIYPIGSMSLSGNNGTSSQSYTITYTDTFKGNIDGGNHIITYTMITDEGLGNGTNSLGLFGAIENSKIKNLVINADVTSTRNSVWVGGLAGFGCYCDLENVVINGTITAKHDVGGFFGYYANEGINTTNIFKNCVNNATVTCNSGRTGNNYAICGGFVGQLSPDTGSSYNEYSLIFENCQSNGAIIIGTASCTNSAASYFVGFASDNAASMGKNIRFVFNNCSVGNDASFTSSLGDTRTLNNNTIYCGSSTAAISACPAIEYVGVTSGLWAVDPANGAKVKVIIDNNEQDMSLYFVK